MDRKANNRRLREIVQKWRATDGTIPAIAVATLITELQHHLDECVETALSEGYPDAKRA